MNMNLLKLYCPICRACQDVVIVKRDETYPVKGENITVQAAVCTCAVCGEELTSPEHDDETLRKVYYQYRSLHGLLQPEEIKAIREQYQVSQTAFARILGVGDKTIARYENGSLQDEAINNLILLARNPENFLTLFEKNKSKLSPDEISRIEKHLGRATVYVKWESSFPKDYYCSYSSTPCLDTISLTAC